MKAFTEFEGLDRSFWSFIRYISENIGYTKRGSGRVMDYSVPDINVLLREDGLSASREYTRLASYYSAMRADFLNGYARDWLMDAEEAKAVFMELFPMYEEEGFHCKIPLNKQSAEKKQVAYFTAIINILTEKTLRDITGSTGVLFDDDPRSLSYMWDEDGEIIGASSRRFDGAYPSIMNPDIVWEIKEYYYTTTFGSRIADGVYETQLDGLELKDIYERTGRKVYHVFFTDAYHTWWDQGRSYLCRMIDALNSGIIDEAIIGREVLERWPEVLYEQIGR